MKYALLFPCEATARSRPRPCRLRFEALEDRLAPGDTLLGAALASSWLGLGLLGTAASPSVVADRTDAPSAGQGRAHPADLSNLEVDRTTIAYTPMYLRGK